MNWLARDEWIGPFKEVFDRHLLPACEITGVDADEVVSILGRDGFMLSVWGCAFEDFLTLEVDGGRNIVDDYLKRRGWKESASTRAYMAALRTSVLSLHEVSDIVPNTSFRARDLVRGGDPVLIHERSATRSLKPWGRIAARVVQVRSRTHISGAVLPYDRDASDAVVKSLQKAAKRLDKKRNSAGRADGSVGASHVAGTSSSSATEILRASAPMITVSWLVDVIDRATRPPEIRNAEGDELLFCTTHYPFAADATADEIRSALARCPELAQTSETFWDWLALEPATPKSMARKAPAKSQTIARYSQDGALVLGTVELKDKTVELSVNSQARSERGRALLAGTLGNLVAQPLIETQTVEQLLAAPKDTPPAKLDITPQERRGIIHATMDQHYRKLLDEPIPALGNKSPRAAVKSAKGRAKVADWIKGIENHAAGSVGRNDDMATYDVSWLWAELGLRDLRR
jgi:hypothetical protein